MEQKVLAYVRAHGLIAPGDTVTVALSGGADSTALLTVLLALRGTLQLRLRAAHFHHGLRGAEADRDAAFAEALCRRCGVPFALGRGDAASYARASGESPEEAARTLRYRFLTEQAQGGRLATAHNADDNLETVLLHLLRGSGTRGLAGIPPKRGEIVRPLLCCTRAEILDYLAQKGERFVEDSTNQTDSFPRNRLRHGVVPLLRELEPNAAQAALRSTELLRQEDEYLSQLASAAAAQCRVGDGWSCERLRELSPALRRRVFLGLLRELPLKNPSERFVSALERLCFTSDPSARISLPQGFTACRVYDLLRVSRETPQPALEETALNLPGVTVLSGNHGQIAGYVTKNSNNSEKNPYTFSLRCDMIAAGRWHVRPRRTGDMLTLPGGAKSLKRLMIDRKLPRERRDHLPVLVCGETVAAVPGLGVDLRFRPAPDDAEVLTVIYTCSGLAP